MSRLLLFFLTHYSLLYIAYFRFCYCKTRVLSWPAWKSESRYCDMSNKMNFQWTLNAILSLPLRLQSGSCTLRILWHTWTKTCQTHVRNEKWPCFTLFTQEHSSPVTIWSFHLPWDDKNLGFSYHRVCFSQPEAFDMWEQAKSSSCHLSGTKYNYCICWLACIEFCCLRTKMKL